jgi:ferredoxin
VSAEPARHLQIVIDRELCMGSGNCVYWAGAVFDVGDDMVAHVVGDPDEHRDRVLVAAEHCPTHAISIQPA